MRFSNRKRRHSIPDATAGELGRNSVERLGKLNYQCVRDCCAVPLRDDRSIAEPARVLGERRSLGDDTVTAAHESLDELVPEHLLEGRSDKGATTVENWEKLTRWHSPV